MQGRPSGEREEEEEGNLETEPIHYASGQSAERQLAQHLQSRQETVVSRLMVRGRSGEVEWGEKRGGMMEKECDEEVKERELRNRISRKENGK